MARAFESIKQGLTEAIGHANGTQACAKVWRPRPWTRLPSAAAWA